MDEFFETDIPNDETSLEKSILEISEKLVHYPNDYILLRQYSKNLLQTNDETNYKIALDSAKKSISIKPNDFASKILILKSLRHLKRYDEALDYAEHVEDEFPDNDQILEEISSCLLELNRNTEAEKILKKLELVSPEKSRYNFGCLHLNYQNYEIALGFFSGILQENPSHIKSAIQKSYVLIQLGSMSKAILFCEKFINDYPENSAQIWRNLAGAYYRAGKISLEKNGYVEKESLDDHAVVDSKPVIRYELPVESKKFFQQAMNAYRTIGDMKISTPETAYFKAVTYSNLELFEDALVAIDESLQQSKHWNILSYKCHVLYRLRQYDEALLTCNEVLKDFPRDSIALAAKVNSLWGLQRISEYELEFKRVQKMSDEFKQSTNSEIKHIEYFAIDPDTPFDNWMNWTDFFSTFSGNIWIKDRYPNRELLKLLFDYVNFDRVNEIKILAQYSLENGGKDLVNRFCNFTKDIDKFNENFGDDTLQIRIFFKKDPGHDRYVISEDNEWNTTGMYQVEENQRSDVYKIPDSKQVTKDKEFFNHLWNIAIPLNTAGWSKILNTLEKKLKEQGIPSKLEPSDRTLKHI